MNFFKILDRLKKKESASILHGLLERIPIFVFGENISEINEVLIELTELIHFRKEFVYNTDFISEDEYNDLIQNEDIDYTSQRIQIRCPSEVALTALEKFEIFKSWVIGIVIPEKKEDLNHIKNLIKKKTDLFFSLYLEDNNISLNLEDFNLKELDLSLEQNILQKISKDTENSIIRMKRILSDNIKLKKIDDDLIHTLLDFQMEKNELKKNILKKEIQIFYSGSKRAFFILSRLNLLFNLNVEVSIGSNTILETIDYEEASINRIISFINQEWGVNYSNLIANDNKNLLMDKIHSLWG
ncbi:MAG: hypothetical protein EU539_01585 [Promethearchaeota archaeon]|nr:MAG: hypothetical protein EU539_01585 [Candidatus Lokiarchaeota archaeon]